MYICIYIYVWGVGPIDGRLLEVAMNTTVAAAVGGITVFLCRLGTSKKYEAWQEKRRVLGFRVWGSGHCSFRVQGLVGFSNYAGSFLPRDAGVLVLC